MQPASSKRIRSAGFEVNELLISLSEVLAILSPGIAKSRGRADVQSDTLSQGDAVAGHLIPLCPQRKFYDLLLLPALRTGRLVRQSATLPLTNK